MQEDSPIQKNESNHPHATIPDLDRLTQRQLVVPSLLFLSGNLPLALVSGQLLHLLAPILNIVMPNWTWDQWARLLSSPNGVAHILKTIEEELESK